MTNLIHRLEAAEGPGRGLDEQIAEATGWDPEEHHGEDLPAYTASLDAAVSLVPEGCAWQVTERLDNLGGSAMVQRRGKDKPFDIWKDVEAATPALALCIAALRAREAENG